MSTPKAAHRFSLNLVLTTTLAAVVALMLGLVAPPAYASAGSTWTVRETPGGYWNGVAYGAGTYVAVAADKVMTSPDGITWTERKTDIPKGSWVAITYAEGKFVAVANIGDARAMTSPDGINWTAQSSLTESYIAVTHGDDTFVATRLNNLGYSTDGVTWQEGTLTSGTNANFDSVVYGDDTFVAVNKNKDATATPVLTSNDGVNWTERTADIPVGKWSAVTYAAGKFVAVAEEDLPDEDSAKRVMTSVDGVTWTVQTAPQKFWLAITYADGQFIAVGTSGAVMTSPDAETWTLQTSDNSETWNSIVAGPQLVALGHKGGKPPHVMTSFIYDAPTVSSVSPASGSVAGGDALTITGTGLRAGAAVTLGDAACTDVTIVSATQLTCTTPAGTLGGVTVTVINNDSQQATGTFTYEPAPEPTPAPVPVFPPSAVPSVTADAGDAAATVAWDTPTSAGSFPITTYQVRTSPDSTGCLTPATTTTCVIAPLENNTQYTLQVRALNGAGWGPWSALHTVTPEPRIEETIQITGTRSPNKRMVFITGTTTGLVGAELQARVRLMGTSGFFDGSTRTVDAEGGFEWQRRGGRGVQVFFTTDTTQSNRVKIPRG